MNRYEDPCSVIERHGLIQSKLAEPAEKVSEGEKTKGLVDVSILAIVMSDEGLHCATNCRLQTLIRFSAQWGARIMHK